MYLIIVEFQILSCDYVLGMERKKKKNTLQEGEISDRSLEQTQEGALNEVHLYIIVLKQSLFLLVPDSVSLSILFTKCLKLILCSLPHKNP